MANVGVGSSSEKVLEGFLCPVCLQDLTSIAQLQVHFEEKHATEDSTVLNSLKFIFSKAKKIFDSDSENDDDGDSGKSASGAKLFTNPFTSGNNTLLAASTQDNSNNPWSWESPSRGPRRSHSYQFKTIRSDRIDAYVAETNKLLIRLDKLLTDMPSDPVKRKAHERHLVPWVDNDCVPLCPDCGRTFNAFTSRRHHCRLCGSIMCHTCSNFLSMAYAKKLVAPVHVASSMSGGGVEGERRSPSSSRSVGGGGKSGGFSVPGFGVLKRSGSQGSLNSLVSVMDSFTGEQHLRVCTHCNQRTRARDRAVELRQSKPLLSLLYTKLMADRSRMTHLLPQYSTMARSLSSGESVYSLRDANELRTKLLRLGDSINATAQKIRTLGPVDAPDSAPTLAEGEAPPSPGPRQELLQRRIQQTSTAFLKTHVFGLDKLPDHEHLQQLQETRRAEAALRLAAEREASELAEKRAEQTLHKMRQQQRDASSDAPSASIPRSGVGLNSRHQKRPSPAPHERRRGVVGEEGWGGDSDAHIVTATDDPVIQQMNIIRNYIRQARDACRYDEVTTLEKNLRELQSEYRLRMQD